MLLGIDYGKKNIGLAIADGKTAVPYDIILNNDLDNIVIKLKDLIEQEQIEKIIVGVPYNMQGEKTAQTLEILEFIEKIKKQLGIDVIEFDERLSSKAADKLLEKDKRKKDSVAAMIILQDYMDRNL